MNEVGAKAVPALGGYEGHFRKVHKAAWEAVEKGGVVQIYGTAFEAETMAWRALRDHLCRDIVGNGVKSSLRAAANQHFKKLYPGKGRKPVEVVRR